MCTHQRMVMATMMNIRMTPPPTRTAISMIVDVGSVAVVVPAPISSCQQATFTFDRRQIKVPIIDECASLDVQSLSCLSMPNQG